MAGLSLRFNCFLIISPRTCAGGFFCARYASQYTRYAAEGRFGAFVV